MTGSLGTPKRNANDILFSLAPQMKSYIEGLQMLTPILHQFEPPSKSNPVFATDRLGFRNTMMDGRVIDCDTWQKEPRKGLIIGGSAVFGTGATSDNSTVASLLSEQLGVAFLNLGIRGGMSSAETAAMRYFADQAETIIVFSGHNNLHAGLFCLNPRAPFSQLFAEHIWRRIASVATSDLIKATRSGTGLGCKTDPAHLNAAIPTFTDTVDLASASHRRDLELLTRIAGPQKQILFALQPFALLAKSKLTLEEQRLFDLFRRRRADNVKPFWDDLPKLYPVYSSVLKNICKELSIAFLDFNNCHYTGWCFIDPVHLTDHGNAIVARELLAAVNQISYD